MKNRRDNIKVRSAILALTQASLSLGDIRPLEEMESEELFELCRIKEEIDSLRDSLKTMLKKGGEV